MDGLEYQFPFGDGLFSGAMLFSGSVSHFDVQFLSTLVKPHFDFG